MTPLPGTELPIPPVWIVAFSGHRPSTDPGRSARELAECRDALQAVFSKLQRTAADGGGAIHLLCGVAEGSDLLAIQIARDIGMPVHLILPKPAKTFLKDFSCSSSAVREEVEAAISFAHEEDNPWTLRTARSEYIEPDCYYDANVQMLRVADLLVAIVVPGSPCTTGSTAEMIDLARPANEVAHEAQQQSLPGAGIPVVRIDPRTRETSDWAWDPRATPTDADKWLEMLNSDLQNPKWRGGAAGHQRGDGEEEPIWQVHMDLDRVAINSSGVFRNCLWRAIWFHFFASTLAAGAAAFSDEVGQWPRWLIGLLCFSELLLVGLGLVCMLRAFMTKANRVWQRSRLAAEFVDSQIHCACIVDPLYPPIRWYGKHWTGFSISIAIRAHRERESLVLSSMTKGQRFLWLKERYRTKRVGYQLENYLRPEGAQAHSWGTWCHWGMIGASIATVVAVGCVFQFKMSTAEEIGVSEHAHHYIKVTALFLTILLPLIVSLAAALEKAKSAERRSYRYAEGAARLEVLSRLIERVKTPEALKRLVAEAEDVLLDDLIDWHTTAAVTRI